MNKKQHKTQNKEQNKDLKKKKHYGIKTKRTIVTAIDDEELEALIKETQDEGLRVAYEEMLSGCKANPESRVWYTPWKICLKGDKQCIGYVGFKGQEVDGSVEIGYGIDEAYRNKGYCKEVLKAIVEWVFSEENIYFIEAETEDSNEASKKVLASLEFKADGEGEEGPRFVLERPVTAWMPIYMCIGVGGGMSFGLALNNSSMGMCIGICIGLLIGAALDSQEKKKREELKSKREEKKKDKQGK